MNFRLQQMLQYLETVNKTHIHEFQVGILYSYADLPKAFEQGKFKIFKNGDFIIKDTYYYAHEYNAIEFANILKRYNVISLYHLPALKPEKRCEVTYNLDEVFNRQSYASGKKYRDKVTRGLNYFKRNNITVREMRIEEIPKALSLYNQWCDYKLKVEKVFAIMFPVARYRRTLTSAYKGEITHSMRNLGVFTQEGKLLGFRSIYSHNDEAYDGAYITNRNADITDFSEFFEIATLKYMKENFGVKFFNCGLSTGKLKDFKKHLPNKEITYYRYKRLTK